MKNGKEERRERGEKREKEWIEREKEKSTVVSKSAGVLTCLCALLLTGVTTLTV